MRVVLCPVSVGLGLDRYCRFKRVSQLIGKQLVFQVKQRCKSLKFRTERFNPVIVSYPVPGPVCNCQAIA